MTIPLDPVPDIVLLFRGMLAMSIKEGGPYCDVGIIREAIGHDLVAVVAKVTKTDQVILWPYDPTEQLAAKFSLTVDSPDKKIRLFKPKTKPKWNRKLDQGDGHDFRWLLDLEGREAYGEQIDVDPEGLRSIFRINDGLFFTVFKSKDELRRIRKRKSKELGRVALAVGAFIYLDSPGSKAVFKHGETELTIEREPNTIHVIIITQTNTVNHHAHSKESLLYGEHPNHSVLYQQAIKAGKNTKKRLRFESTEFFPGNYKYSFEGKRTKANALVFDIFDLITTGDPMAACAMFSFGKSIFPEKEIGPATPEK